jgi:hypothetical protein
MFACHSCQQIYSTKEVGRTLEFEGEVVGQVSALMVAAKEEKGVGVPYFQGPQV